MNFKKIFDWLIPSAFILSLIFLGFAAWWNVKNRCSIDNFYEIGQWSECKEGGVRTRVVSERQNDACWAKSPPDRPVDKENCEYIPNCKDEDYVVGAWDACANDEQHRTVQLKEKVNCSEVSRPPGQRTCTVESKTLLLKDYTTQIDLDAASGNAYEPNYRNIKIIPKGKFKTLKLHVAASTSVLGGELIQVPEYYYFMLGINDSVARVLATYRIDSNRLDLNSEGVFNGTEMPIEKEFNLNDAILAESSSEYSPGGIGNGGIGSSTIGGGATGFISKDYSQVLNESTGKPIFITLFLADGRSMVERDLKNRIFGTITFAYLEYECESSGCSIERTPDLQP